MMRPLTPDRLSDACDLVAGYISGQRNNYRPLAVPLSTAQTESMAGFFLPELLASTRLLVLGEPLETPAFYDQLRDWGFTDLPDFSGVIAITFDDVIVSQQPFANGLLFHELVHVVQYSQLGVERFANLYTSAFFGFFGRELLSSLDIPDSSVIQLAEG